MDKPFGAFCYCCHSKNVTITHLGIAKCLACGVEHRYISGGYLPKDHKLVVVPGEPVEGAENDARSASVC